MKTAYTYRLIWLLIAFQCSQLCGYGQAVTGDKYNAVAKTKVISITTLDGLKVGYEKIGSAPPSTAFFDNKMDTWWAANKGGTLVMKFDCGSSHNPISSFRFYYGGDKTERPDSVKIEQSDTLTSGWKKIYEEKITYPNPEKQDWLNLSLTTPITKQYVRITFVRNDGNCLAFNEIDLGVEVVEVTPFISHKHAKWHDLRNKVSESSRNMDTFNDTTLMFSPNNNPLISSYTSSIQAAHTYIDTIYMHRGTSIKLSLPDRLEDDNSVKAYQRWYSFRRDSTFETNHADSVYDLLTPVSGTVSRFANGYVGSPVNNGKAMDMNFYMPTSEEFKKWFPNNSGFDDKWFVVACDVSCYNDYTETYSESGSPGSTFYDGSQAECWEPTLSHRVLFFISAVDDRDEDKSTNWVNGHYRLKHKDYQGGGNGEGKKYLEEYTITWPYYRLSGFNNNGNDKLSSDAVALSKDARSYAIPDADVAKETDTLKVTLADDNTAQITLCDGYDTKKKETTVSGTSRTIQFSYPIQSTSDYRWQAEGESATILVTKNVAGTIYNIARYKLKFVKDVTLLTQSIIETISDNDDSNDGEWAKYKTRTPEYLKTNYQLLTSLTWDYDSNVSGQFPNQDNYYWFPMDWSTSSYAFYDGSYKYESSNKPGDLNGNYEIPEWGYYGITKDYIEVERNWEKAVAAKEPNGGTYHLYIDASDRPGAIAELPIDEDLCTGAELFVSAWVKDAGYKTYTAGAGMLFTIMGVTEEGTNVPLYRYSTGQFRRTAFVLCDAPGFGPGTNDWLHVYFSFINDVAGKYKSYLLRIDNYSLSTAGADMYLDDVRIYMAQPSAVMKQLTVACGDEPTRMNIDIDWDRLSSRAKGNHVVGNNDMGAIDYCFVDKWKYEELLAKYKEENNEDSIKFALEGALVSVLEGQNDSAVEYKYSQVFYNLNYNENAVYGENDTTLVSENQKDVTINGEVTKRGFFYRRPDDYASRALTLDFFSRLTPNRPYWMLISLSGSGIRPTSVDVFLEDFNEPCGIRTEFYVEATNQVTIEGEPIDPTLNEYCEGQLLNFRVNMRYTTGEKNADGSVKYEYFDDDEVLYDWFFGSEEQFTDTLSKCTFSIKDALEGFRRACPDDSSLPLDYADISATSVFTKAMYDTLSTYYNRDSLILSKNAMDIRLLRPGLQLIVYPVISSIDAGSKVLCSSYIPLTLKVIDGAPWLMAGYAAINYPDVGKNVKYQPNLRIGLDQIKNATADNPIICNLCAAKFSTESSKATHLGRVTAHESQNKIYLVDTDDPEMKSFIVSTPGQYALPIGTVDYLRAVKDNNTEDNLMKIHFDVGKEGVSAENKDFKFEPREGYKYMFSVYFEEKIREVGKEVSESAGNSCIGVFNITMCVVPEYVIWNGGAADNWSNDYNWKRVNSASRIQRTTGTYEEYTDLSFVPMQFSKVILPRDSKVELYIAGYDNSSSWNADGRPAYMGKPTDNIWYDLMAVDYPDDDKTYPGQLRTALYRVYWIDKIHFEPGSQMRGAEYLIYNGAEIDYELEHKKWHSITSPLQGTVAGDFYTNKTTAKESGEYFTDITFNSTDYSRLSPYVFQRDWDADSAMVIPIGGGEETNVAFTSNWSGVYNDVDEWETYQPGAGFSLKVTQLPQDTTALFRLPKADKEYKYYKPDGTETSIVKNVEQSRTKYHGHLITDSLFHRVAYEIKSSKGKSITIDLPAADKGKYYMIGNPFMTELDVKKFFGGNETVIEPKYWLANSDKAAAGSSEYWVSSDKNGNLNIPPLQAFFVQKKDTSKEDTIYIHANMQAPLTTTQASGAKPGVLYMTATASDGWTSNAAVVYDDNASAGYDDERDVIMFINPANGGMPQVYTAGGGYALSINTVPSGSRIPVGVCGSIREDVMLRFGGVSACGDVRLYDSRERSETALYDGYELTVTANDDGRYYIVGGSVSGISSPADGEHGISIYSVRRGEITVAGDAADIVSVVVYGADGGMRASAVGDSRVVNVPVAPGVAYIVRATAADGTSRTAKVLVR